MLNQMGAQGGGNTRYRGGGGGGGQSLANYFQSTGPTQNDARYDYVAGQQRMAEREPVPVGGIDAGQIIEHAQVEFGQLGKSWGPGQQIRARMEGIVAGTNCLAAAVAQADYWRRAGAPQAL